MLTVLNPTVFSYYPDLALPPQSGQGFVWSLKINQFTVVTVFIFFGACCDGTVGFTCHGYRIYRSRQGALELLAHKAPECVDDIGLSSFLKWSFFDPALWGVIVARSTEGDWMGLKLLNTWFPHRWQAGEVLDLPEGHNTVLRKPALGRDAHRAC